MTAPPAEAPPGAEPFHVPSGATSIEVTKQFASFKVVPKDGEAQDANFPPHLHAAVELFCHAGGARRQSPSLLRRSP